MRSHFPTTNVPVCLFRTLLLLATVLGAPRHARPNAAPVHSGDPAGEVTGLKATFVEREALWINMKEAVGGGPVYVQAEYQLRHDGEPQSAKLVFVTGTDQVLSLGIKFDEQWLSYTSSQISNTRLPANWRPARETPAVGGRGGWRYFSQETTLLRFKVSLTPGRHRLVVSYRARSYGSPSDRTGQFVYVLAPARSWAGFGELSVDVPLPHGCLAASDPPLNRSGDDRLSAAFQGIPSDSLAISLLEADRDRWRMANAYMGWPLVVAIIAVLVPVSLIIWGRWPRANHEDPQDPPPADHAPSEG